MVESEVEEAALEWLESLGWAYRGGPEIPSRELFAERDSYGQVILAGRRSGDRWVSIQPKPELAFSRPAALSSRHAARSED
jgi:type I restriction enzyme R subunit